MNYNLLSLEKQQLFHIQYTLVQEVRRQRMAAAAEQRQREADARGVKDPQLLKEKQARRETAEKAAASQPASSEGGLRVWLCASGLLHCTYISMLHFVDYIQYGRAYSSVTRVPVVAVGFTSLSMRWLCHIWTLCIIVCPHACTVIVIEEHVTHLYHSDGYVCTVGGHVCTVGGHVCTVGGHVCTVGGHVCTVGGHVCTVGGHVCTVVNLSKDSDGRRASHHATVCCIHRPFIFNDWGNDTISYTDFQVS